MGRGGGGADRTRRDPLVRRLGRGVRPALRRSWSTAGRSRRLSEAKRPNSYLALSDPGDVARVEDRTFICSATEAGGRPDQQLARPGGDARDADRAVRGSMRGRTMYVVPFSMGPLGSDHSYIGRAADRLPLRRGEHADHDAHGPGRARRAGQPRRFRPVPALGGHAAERGRRRRAVAVQRREQVHRALPRDAGDLVLRLGLRRQRAARQEVLRAADRLGDGARRGLDGRAHADPQADLARRARSSTSPAPSRARAARRTSRC